MSSAESESVVQQESDAGSQAPLDSTKPVLSRVNRALGPIFAGMILDSVDLVTFGPVGLLLGLPVGAAAGYWLGRSMRLDHKSSLICAAAAAVYCTIPGTELLPLGTLVGALVRFEESGKPDPPVPQSSGNKPSEDSAEDGGVV